MFFNSANGQVSVSTLRDCLIQGESDSTSDWTFAPVSLGARALCGCHDSQFEPRAPPQKVAGHSHSLPPRAEHHRPGNGGRRPRGKHWQNHLSRYLINMQANLILDWCTYPLMAPLILCMFSQLMNLQKIIQKHIFISDPATEWAFVVHAHGDGAVCYRTPPPCFAKSSSFPLHVHSSAGTLSYFREFGRLYWVNTDASVFNSNKPLSSISLLSIHMLGESWSVPEVPLTVSCPLVIIDWMK